MPRRARIGQRLIPALQAFAAPSKAARPKLSRAPTDSKAPLRKYVGSKKTKDTRCRAKIYPLMFPPVARTMLVIQLYILRRNLSRKQYYQHTPAIPTRKTAFINGTVVPLPTNAATFPLQARHRRATINNALSRQETVTKRRLPSAAKNLNPKNQSYRKENS